jgi:hypothetical protein
MYCCYTSDMKNVVPILCVQAFLFFAIPSAHAATLYLDPNQAQLNRGDSITVSVRLDTNEDECVNAIDGVITYTENIQPVDISRGNSIFSMWVEEPIINKADRTITFAGGIPNGYCGRIPGDPRLTNNVVDLVFQSPGLQIGSSESGNMVQLAFDQKTTVYLNDGFGTIASTTFFGTTIDLTRQPGPAINNPWGDKVTNDNIFPEAFSITLERTPNAFSNNYFITFNTTDKQSGIDHYEVIEEPLDSKNLFGWGAETAPWIEAKSPYVLEDQSLNSTIRVRAIDKAGNEYIATYVPNEAERSISVENIVILGVLAVVGVLVLAGLVILFTYIRNKRKQKQVQSEDDDLTNDDSSEVPSA